MTLLGRWRVPNGWLIAAACFAPGAILGLLFAQLLFFLNPHLPLAAPTIARAMVAYGGTGGLASLLLLAAASGGRRRRAARLLPWALTVALVLAAVLGWVLPSYFAYYLPPGINERLIKAALWITAAAVVCFYTALLHAIYRRRYGTNSRVGLVLCALVSVLAMAERRGAFPPSAETTYRPTLLEHGESPPRLLVIGLDGATLDAVLPLAEQGLLPFFARLLEGGSHGHLASLAPTRSGAVWTTLATGKLPYRHGVVASRVFPQPALGRGVELKLVPPLPPFYDWARLGVFGRLADGGERRVLALWEMSSRLGLDTALVSWPVSSPLSAELSAGVSDRFFSRSRLAEALRPEDARPLALGLRAREEAERGKEGMTAVDPRFAVEVGQALAGDRLRLEIAAWTLAEEPTKEAVFLVLPGLRTVSARTFGGYSAVEFEGIQRSPYLEAARALEAYYAQLDALLAAFWQEHGEGALLAVVSAFGTEPAAGWQRVRAELSESKSLSGYFSGAPDGVLILYGEDVRSGGRLENARLVDVVPTLLYGLGFPVPGDLDGQVLRDAFTPDFLARHPLTFVSSYEALSGPGPSD